MSERKSERDPGQGLQRGDGENHDGGNQPQGPDKGESSGPSPGHEELADHLGGDGGDDPTGDESGHFGRRAKLRP